MLRRTALLAIMAMTLASCLAQVAPPRSSLPPVESLVDPPVPCQLVVGEGLGVSVDDVIAGSGAEGILVKGDLLVEIDGVAIHDADQLRAELSGKGIGETVMVGAVRDGAEIDATVILGANPDSPERPLLGIMAATAYNRVEPAELEGVMVTGAFARPVDIGGEILIIEPETGSWGQTGLTAPEGSWIATASGVFILEDPSTEAAALVDASAGVRIVFGLGDWRAGRLMGTLGGRAVIGVNRPVGSSSELVEAGVALADLETKQIVWLWSVDDAGLGLPVASLPSPSADKLLVVGSDQETSSFHYLVMNGRGQVTVASEGLTEADGAVALGWFDDSQVLMVRDGTTSLLDTRSGAFVAAPLPDSLAGVTRVWAVGNGRDIIADVGTDLVRADLKETAEVRTLAERCGVGQIGDPGWGG